MRKLNFLIKIYLVNGYIFKNLSNICDRELLWKYLTTQENPIIDARQDSSYISGEFQ